MLIKCSNPTCETLFDYREGRIVRYPCRTSNGKGSEKGHLIQHFWLCARCDGLYVIEYESGTSVKIKPRHQKLTEENLAYFVSTA